jgi:cytochrome c2
VIPVVDAHRLDPTLWSALGTNFGPEEQAYADVSIKAMATFILNQRDPTGRLWSREDPKDPGHGPLYANDPPPGDVENGRRLVNDLGCIACHVVPEIRRMAAGGETFEPDSAARFGGDPLLMRGPRLLGLGSKIKSRRWLDAWLENPRHYTEDTRMPDMRIEDLVDPVTGEVVRTGAQRRADVVDYLLSFRDAEFDALEPVPFKSSYEPILRRMYEYFFGSDEQGLKPLRRVSAEIGDLGDERRLGTVLAMVGERLMSRNGCFGCHAVAGHEFDNPIGTELTRHGVKDLHQLDFGRLGHLVHHSRADYYRTKITYPRIFDSGRVNPWFDVLRMPRFNFRSDDPPAGASAEERRRSASTRALVTGILLGQVKEPILPGAMHHPTEYEADVIAGRRVVKRYGCNNCHTIEGKKGFLWGLRTAENPNTADVPPNLFTQGLRTQSEWLFKFLREPKSLRPIVSAHMPKFGLSPAEAEAVVRYFIRLTGEERGIFIPNPDSRLDAEGVAQAKGLFDAINCNKCHLPKGTPGADPQDGGVAPSFALARERLRAVWVRALLNDPKRLIHNTKMPQAWTSKTGYGRVVLPQYEEFRFHLERDPAWKADFESSDPERKNEAEKRLAEVQMEALTDYLIHHYQPPGATPVGSGD